MKTTTFKLSINFIKKTTLITVLAVIFSANSFGQEVYINVNQSFGPGIDIASIDVPGYGSSADIIISSDGSFLNIEGEVGSTDILQISGLAMIYDPPQVISSASETGGIVFNATQSLMADDTGTTGNWDNVNPAAYIGYRIVDGGGYHYGWVEITTNLTGGIHWSVERVGYNQTLNAAITVGSGVLSVEKNEFSSNVNVILNDNELSIVNLPEVANYKIYAITGQVVNVGVAQKNNATINTSKLTSGVYILKVVGNETGSSLTRKIIIQ